MAYFVKLGTLGHVNLDQVVWIWSWRSIASERLEVEIRFLVPVNAYHPPELKRLEGAAAERFMEDWERYLERQDHTEESET